MTMEALRDFFLSCTVVNLVILLLWLLLLTIAGGWCYRIHSKWFKITREHFDTMHYAGMGLFKMGIILFNFTPYIALVIMG